MFWLLLKFDFLRFFLKYILSPYARMQERIRIYVTKRHPSKYTDAMYEGQRTLILHLTDLSFEICQLGQIIFGSLESSYRHMGHYRKAQEYLEKYRHYKQCEIDMIHILEDDSESSPG